MTRAIGLAGALCLLGCTDETAVLGHFQTSHAGGSGQVEAAGGDPTGSAPDTGAGGASSNPSEGGNGGDTRDGGSTDSGAGQSGSSGGGPIGDTLEIEPGPRADFCLGTGPAIHIVSNASDGTGAPICTPTLGRRLFGYGLCSCSDLNIVPPSTLFGLDAFDSNDGAFTTGESGAALGVDGALNAAASIPYVSGSAIIAGRGSLRVNTTLSFGADLKTNATIDFGPASTGVFGVARDLWVDADLHAGFVSSVGRDLYQTPGHSGMDTLTSVGGSRQTRTFTVDPPCACGSDAELDVAALVARAETDNDDAELGLSAAALGSTLEQGTIPSGFECGRFAFGSVSIPSATLEKVHGRLALFIDGDLTLNGDFASDLGSQGELDVLVRGNLVVVGPAQIGMTDRPSALRLYVGGSQPIQITELVRYAAQIYAPHAPLKVMATTASASTVQLTFYGSIFAAGFETSSPCTLHYDRAIVDLGDTCTGSPPRRCDSCEQCPSGLACVDGACAACRSDADCCDPFACVDGKCRPLIYSAP